MSLQPLADARLIAVVRAPSAADAVSAGHALLAGGVTAVEITYTTPDAAAAIARLRAELPELLVGAGTVISTAQLRESIDAGAAFAVSPHLDPAIAQLAVDAGLAYLPGVLTPTEVAAARAYSPVLKLFPASLGGVGHLKALRGPFPDVQFVPTGGVNPGNVADWFAAGAFAVGAGSDLLADGDPAEITRRARAYVAALGAVA
ncbi:MAG TPA: bifunctional 4-hydroxy-2-oxoglutarate aldolase/2-dehydro-3-deoxy-phosphogluconate aldolase [Solirubrobacter sp.]|nr:bifunctional 4-hydroxy-2-oxoglutarate aldolase/2-dehydro-3-deoxy-phosphogluconate aldolase [Solirubrobacter sp.]